MFSLEVEASPFKWKSGASCRFFLVGKEDPLENCFVGAGTVENELPVNVVQKKVSFFSFFCVGLLPVFEVGE